MPTLGWAQSIVSLQQWPARLQLYARNPATNECRVAIAGRVPGNAATAVSLVVLRNQQPQQYIRHRVDTLTGRFDFAPAIRAELSEYSVRLFAHRPGGDSVLVAARDSIVCGDVFLITGQSNAIGRFDQNAYRSEFCRTFGVNQPDNPYNPADTAWCLTNTTEGVNSLWGVELQRLIEQQQRIPTAIINGAAGSTSIHTHSLRDGSQPDNLNTIYGRLLYRARKAGVATQALALIWRQGEAEAAANDPDQYVRLYPQLYGNWKQDYPGLKRVYHGQLNILTDNALRAGLLRDYQRRTGDLFPDHVPIATVGLPGYQGVHYTEAGYRQFGAELYRLVARDIYGSTDTSNITSPNIRRIFYSTPEQNEITLEFEPGQVMRWPADTVIVNPANGNRYAQNLSNFIYADYPTGENNLIESVTERGNRLVLKLTKPVRARHLTYLPSFYNDGQIGYYVGPVLRNRRGMRALTFYQVAIAPPLPVAADLRAVPVDTSAIKLSWGVTSTDVEKWIIERADSSGNFRELARIGGLATTYDDHRRPGRDDSLRLGAVYQYRIRSLGRQAEAPYSPVVSASLQLVLATKPAPGSIVETTPVLLVYPNPASDQVRVQLPAHWSGELVAIALTNALGTTVLQQSSRPVAGTPALTFSVAALPVGSYLLTLTSRTGRAQGRLLVTR